MDSNAATALTERAPRPDLGAGGTTSAQETHETRVGTALCLSGGGYRAALFHLGALIRLDERRLLSRIDTFSTVSGGSITGAALFRHVTDWGAPGDRVAGLDAVREAVLETTRQNVRTGPVAQRLLPWNWTDTGAAVEALEEAYAEGVAGDLDLATLRSGPGRRPRWVLCATDITFGECFRFDTGDERHRYGVGSDTAGWAEPAPGTLPVARAVAASSCFPPVFDPMPLSDLGVTLVRDDVTGDDAEELRARVALSDGGVFDNLGVTPVWDDTYRLLVSNGGAVFEPQSRFDALGRLDRYIAVAGNGGEYMRTKIIRENDRAGRFDGALWDIADEVADPTPVDHAGDVVRARISNIRTDLDAFSDVEQRALVNRGYTVTEHALGRQLADASFLEGSEAPFAVPCVPPTASEVWEQLAGSHDRTLLGRGIDLLPSLPI